MNSFSSLMSSFAGSAPYTVGVVLLHFLWQGAVLATGLALALRATQHHSARLRHALSCGTLFLMVLCPVLTFGWISARTGLGSGSGFPSSVLVPTLASSPVGPTSQGTHAVSSWGIFCLPWLTLGWLVGVGIFTTRLVGGWWQVHRLATRHVQSAPSEWQHRLLELQTRLRIAIPVRLLESNRIQSPMVIGWIRPVILLPVGLLTGMPTAQIEALLLHELAHIRGNDYLINLLQRIAETVLFYHPAVWWVSNQIRRERENRCDDVVLAAMGEARSLAGALVALVEQTQSAPTLAMASDGGSVADRVRRMLGAKPSANSTINGWRPLKWGVAAAILIGIGYLVIPTLLAPKLYKSTSRIRIDTAHEGSAAGAPDNRYDPYMIQIQAEKIRSTENLGQIVHQESLVKRWNLSPSECVEILRGRIRVQQYRNTGILEVTAASEDKNEAANLANSAVRQFQQQNELKAIEEQQIGLEFASKRLDRLQAMRRELRDQVQNLEPGLKSSDHDLAARLTSRLGMIQQLILEEEKRQLVASLDRPRIKTTIEIIDSAEPGRKPVRWTPVKP